MRVTACLALNRRYLPLLRIVIRAQCPYVRVGAQMKITRVISVFVIIASVGLGSVNAKTLRGADEPAEFPPASFKGKQYVDSRGCVYVRAGIDGNVTWVPRVSRSRQHICGAQPTFAKAKPAETAPAPVQVAKPAKPAPKPRPVKQAKAAKPAPKAVAKPAPQPVISQPKPRVKKTAPQQVVVRKPKPAPTKISGRQPMETVASKMLPDQPAPAARTVSRVKASRATTSPSGAPAPTVIGRVASQPVKPAPRRKTVPARVVSNGQAACQAGSPVSQRYVGRADGSLSVRCGPQAEAPITYGTGTGRIAPALLIDTPRYQAPVAQRQPAYRSAPAAQQVAGNTTRVVPRHVYATQEQSRDLTDTVPQGYRRAWKDDRLNTKRAHQTLNGIAQTDLRWTREVPRRLIDLTSGRDVTAYHPNLTYPFTNLADQQRAYAQAAQKQQRVVVSTKGRVMPAAKTKRVKRTERISTRSTRKAQAAARRQTQTKSTAAKANAAMRYVQVGTFGVAANAQKSAARLQRAGLPVRMGKYSKSGKEFRIVMAGPFQSQAQLNAALSAARKAGFRDAFLRK